MTVAATVGAIVEKRWPIGVARVDRIRVPVEETVGLQLVAKMTDRLGRRRIYLCVSGNKNDRTNMRRCDANNNVQAFIAFSNTQKRSRFGENHLTVIWYSPDFLRPTWAKCGESLFL